MTPSQVRYQAAPHPGPSPAARTTPLSYPVTGAAANARVFCMSVTRGVTVGSMTEIVIAPASADRFADAEHALTGGGDGASCWSPRWWMLRNKDFNATTHDERRELLRTDLAQTPASALIAYVDGEPAGWVKVSPRPDQPRLALTKAFQQSPEPFDDTSVCGRSAASSCAASTAASASRTNCSTPLRPRHDPRCPRDRGIPRRRRREEDLRQRALPRRAFQLPRRGLP